MYPVETPLEASICVCDGRYAGCEHGTTCRRMAGGQWSPHFCVSCDDNRSKHIDRVFDELMQNPIKRYGR